MRRFKERWNNLLPYEKVFHAISWVLVCSGFIVACLECAGYDVLGVLVWLFGLTCVSTAVAEWRKTPGFAFVRILFAFVFLVFAISSVIC